MRDVILPRLRPYDSIARLDDAVNGSRGGHACFADPDRGGAESRIVLAHLTGNPILDRLEAYRREQVRRPNPQLNPKIHASFIEVLEKVLDAIEYSSAAERGGA